MPDYIALLPGQGSQYKRMCQPLLERASAKEITQQASEILGWDVADVMKHGDMKHLTQSDVGQPLVVIASYLLYQAMIEQYGLPKLLIGHSLGELSASLVSGALNLTDALQVVQRRSKLMEEIRQANIGFAGVALDIEPNVLDSLLKTLDQCYISAYNSPTQCMVGGIRGQEKALEEAVFNQGGQYVPYRMIPMRADVAYHSPLMAPYADAFQALYQEVIFQDPQVPIISTIETKIVRQASEIEDLLPRQLLQPVLWTQAIDLATKHSLENWVEVGPGDTLTGLIREVHPHTMAFDRKQDRII